LIQFGIRLHDMKEGTLAERAALAREQGFSCVHLALGKTVPDFPMVPASFTAGLGKHLRNIFAAQGVDIAVLGCYKNLAHPDPVEVKKLQRLYVAHLRMARALGCSVVGTETGSPNAEYKYEPACHTETALQSFLRGVVPVVEAAERLGVIFAIEPVWNHIVWKPQVARRVIHEIASPNLRLILDPVNLLSIENYQQRDRVIEEALDILGEYTEVVHLKDFRVENNRLVSVAAGTGMMDYRAIMDYLKHNKPYIQATLENTVPENAVRTKEYLQEVYDAV